MYGAYSTTTRAGKQAQSDAFCGMDSSPGLAIQVRKSYLTLRMNTTSPTTEPFPLALNDADIYRLFTEFTENASLMHDDKLSIIQAFRRVMQAGLRSIQEEEYSVSFSEAITASLQARRHRRPSTRRDLKSFTNRMLHYRDISECNLRNISAPVCRQMMNELFNHSPHVYRKAQTILHSIFSYGRRQGWCERNPAESLILPPVTEERINILTMPQIKLLLKGCNRPHLRCMNAAVRLMLWCGIRPGEVQRLRWGDIDPSEKMVYVESHASKTGGARAVPLRGGALVLATEHHQPNELIAPKNWIRLWKRLRDTSRLQPWQRDALRHTFASLHLKHYHNILKLQEEMGHRDSSLLRTRYLNLRGVRKSTAREFFSSNFII